jgi:MFS family permease
MGDGGVGPVREQAAESLKAFAEVFRNPELRRLELAWAGSTIGSWAYGIALAVFAYQAGGAAAVGLVGLIRILPSAVASPFAALLADRFPRRQVMILADVVRAAALILAGLAVALELPAGLVYALSAVFSLASATFRPAQAALLPSLATSPGELTAANVASSTIESVGIFLGPALGGVLLATTSIPVVFFVAAGTLVWSAVLVRRIRSVAAAEQPTARPGRLGGELLAGFRAIGVDGRLRLLVGLFSAQTLVDGMLNVLLVVVALELLATGEAGVGYLNSAVGVGGLLGALVALGLASRRLAPGFALGLLLWGLPIALIGIWPNPWLALLLLGVVGVGNTLVDVAGDTLLQRAVADEVLARAFGALESLLLGTLALGAVVAPPLIAGLGIRPALLATGLLLPVLALLTWRRLVSIDAAARPPERQLTLLRTVPIFAPLPAPTLEGLASHLVRLGVPAGTKLFQQGDPGDRFYIIAAGEADVAVDGQHKTLGPGDYFGEIALLRDLPRTATVTAQTGLELYALGRDEFVAAVSGYPPSAEAADTVIATRLSSLRPGVASV